MAYPAIDLKRFFADYFGDQGYPEWCVNALKSVGVDLLDGNSVKVIKGQGAKWEYAAPKTQSEK